MPSGLPQMPVHIDLLARCRSAERGMERQITSEMYRGTRAEARPMPMPASTRPAMMPVRLEAVAASSAPPSRGMASSSSVVLRPSESARPLPPRLPTAAPASRLLTTCNRHDMLISVCSSRGGPQREVCRQHEGIRIAVS